MQIICSTNGMMVMLGRIIPLKFEIGIMQEVSSADSAETLL